MRLKKIVGVVCCVVCGAQVAAEGVVIGGCRKTESFANRIAETLNVNDVGMMIDLVRDEDRATATNDLDRCRLWFSRFKGRRMLVNKLFYKVCYPSNIVAKVDVCLGKGEKLFLYTVVALPDSDGSPADAPHCYLHVVESASGAPRIVGRVVGRQFRTEQDVLACFDVSYRNSQIAQYRYAVNLSDNKDAWKFAMRIEEMLKVEKAGNVRKHLTGVQLDRQYLNFDEFFERLSKARKGMALVVLPYKVEDVNDQEPNRNYRFCIYELVDGCEISNMPVAEIYADFVGGKWILADITSVSWQIEAK